MNNFAKYKEKGLLFDSLEHEYDAILRPDLQIVIRLDGMSFTSKFLKSFSKSTYSIYQECMVNVVHKLCSLFKSTKIAYTHTDEINLILSGREVESNDFNRIQKILTKASSLSSVLLSQFLIEKLHIDNNLSFNDLEKCSYFSAKVHNIPSYEVNKYLKWRQGSAVDFHNDHKDIVHEKYSHGIFIAFIDKKWKEQKWNLYSDHCGKITMLPHYEFYHLVKNSTKKV